jgi:putative transcriptional regulator
MLLVAAPHLVDPNFRSSVVLLCDHTAKGAFGFVLNRPAGRTLEEVLPLPSQFPGRKDPVFVGGPVGLDSMTILHHEGDLSGVKQILPGVFLGGSIDDLARIVHLRKTPAKELRFLVGYSGWGEGQLLNEIKENTWVLRPGRPEWVFDPDPETLWQRVLRSVGSLLTNFPEDPSQN